MQSEGIVLKNVEYKERQRIITVFTSEMGIISLMVYGLSRANPKLLNLTSPLSRIEFTCERTRGEIFRFKDGSILDIHPLIRTELNALKAAGKMVQMLARSQMPEKPSPALYALFRSYLEKLPSLSELLPSSFALKLLWHEGLLSFDALPSAFEREEKQVLYHLAHAKSFSSLSTLTLPEGLEKKIDLLIEEFLG